MLRLEKNNIIYTPQQCQQCGVCISVCPKKAISTEEKGNGLRVIIVDDHKCIRCKKCVNACPSNRVINRTTAGDDFYFDKLPQKEYFLAWNKNESIRRFSSSGGTTKTLIIESLKSGAVDGVYSLRKLEGYPSAIGEFYTKENLPSFDILPNSVYHSIMACRELGKVKKVHRLMIVGTACQLYALEKALKGKYDELLKVCIFCKQQKSLDSTRFLAKAMGAHMPKELNELKTCYRGDGWAGVVRVMDKRLPYHRAAQVPFGRRLWSVPGCNVCGDPFGMECNADVTVMDPWVIRPANNLGETLAVAHTERGKELLEHTSNLVLEHKTYSEIEPALMLKDIWRKRQLVPFFKGEKCTVTVKMAGRAEQLQRCYLQVIAMGFPRLPFIFYRALCKLPDLRNVILR